jgi:hypothetical protein
VLYVLGYMQAAGKRSAGFTIAGLGLIVVLVDGIIGLVRALLA